MDRKYKQGAPVRETSAQGDAYSSRYDQKKAKKRPKNGPGTTLREGQSRAGMPLPRGPSFFALFCFRPGVTCAKLESKGGQDDQKKCYTISRNAKEACRVLNFARRQIFGPIFANLTTSSATTAFAKFQNLPPD